MLQGLSQQAREAKSWPFEQARVLLARILRLRLSDAERDLAQTLIAQGKALEAVQTFPALAQPVVFQCGYGASGLPHMGTFGEAARPTMVRTAFRALTEDAIPTRLIVFSDDMDGLRKIPDNVPNRHILEEDHDKPVTSVREAVHAAVVGLEGERDALERRRAGRAQPIEHDRHEPHADDVPHRVGQVCHSAECERDRRDVVPRGVRAHDALTLRELEFAQ